MSAALNVKVMRLRYAGECACGSRVDAGDRAGWDRSAKRVVCLTCLGADAPSPGLDQPAAPGASLLRQADRREANRQQRIRSSHPRLGGLIVALSQETPSTRAFRYGGHGERVAAASLKKHCGDQVRFLYNRSLGVGRSDGDIDILAVARSGIHIIDVKHYKGKKVEVRRSGGLFSPRNERLYIGGRDRTGLLDSISRQFMAVRAALDDKSWGESLLVRSVLCFVDAELPTFGVPTNAGIPILGPRSTAKYLLAANPILDAQQQDEIAALLAAALPQACRRAPSASSSRPESTRRWVRLPSDERLQGAVYG